ncbi:MAG: hypothetical protein K6D90_02005 [Lachnospiraceae bacterium]|nr:hypothetical protein [Lachnospiraceae bacterium]
MSKTKILILIFSIVAVVSLVAGSAAAVLITVIANKDHVSRYEWIETLCDITDITEYETDDSFFNDVDKKNPHFPIVQAAVEGKILSAGGKLKGDKPATGEFVAVTALRAIDAFKRNHSQNIPYGMTDEEYLDLAIEQGIIDRSEAGKSLSEERCAKIEAMLEEIIEAESKSAETEEDYDMPATPAVKPYKSDDVSGNETEEIQTGNTDGSASNNEDIIDTSGIKLDHHYQTKHGKGPDVPGPVFQFDYPDGWKVTQENYDLQSIMEEVVLEDDRGAKIIYMDFVKLNYDGYFMTCGETVKVADSQFVPSYPEGTDSDMSYLGKFAVVLLNITEQLDMGMGDDYHKVDMDPFHITLAVIPESRIGKYEDLEGQSGIYELLSFDYPSKNCFIAEPPKDGWTDQEKAEAIAILSSFRVSDD